jgi:hypothetical protein
MLIDEQMPQWEQHVVRAEPVDAAPQTTYDAIRRIDFFDSPVVGVPNRVRVIPEQAARWARGQPPVRHPEHFTFEQLLDNGFHLLADDPGREIVLGFIGRWWQRDFGRVDWAPADFRAFQLPGYAVGAWSFAVLPYGDRTSVLVTEVRLRCTDEAARRAFGRYFTVTGPFIKAMGRPVLRLVRRAAERPAKATEAATGRPR